MGSQPLDLRRQALHPRDLQPRRYAMHRADRIVAEVNNGGDMVGATLRMVNPNVAFASVRASRGKMVRAEPVAALYEQGRVHHIGTFPQLEDQMTNFTSDIEERYTRGGVLILDAVLDGSSLLRIERLEVGCRHRAKSVGI